MKYSDITELIGDTPLLKIDEGVHGVENLELYVKLEYYNPFGSLKDRVAWNLLKNDIENIKKEGKTVVESSSGNTAKALQAITSTRGIPFKTITNRIKIGEVKDLLIAMGTDIEELPGKSECPDPNDPDDPLTYIDNLTEGNDMYFRTGQYTDEKNTEAHRKGTGPEIAEDIENVDYFFGGLGTTGSTKGVTQALKERNPEMETIGVVSSSDDFIPGIRTENEMWEVGLYDKDLYKNIVTVKSSDAIEANLELVRKAGVLSGPTTGSQLAAIREYFGEKDLEEKQTAVFLACDRLEPYMSYIKKRKPELFGEEKKDLNYDSEEVSEISVEKLNNWLEKQDVLVVDTRSNPAYRTAHIPGSVNIDSDRLKDLIRTGNPFPDRKIVLVCPTGEESRKHAALIEKEGGEAYNLEKGITEWRDQGMPMENTL